LPARAPARRRRARARADRRRHLDDERQDRGLGRDGARRGAGHRGRDLDVPLPQARARRSARARAIGEGGGARDRPHARARSLSRARLLDGGRRGQRAHLGPRVRSVPALPRAAHRERPQAPRRAEDPVAETGGAMSLLAMGPAIVLWLIGRNSFARLFGVQVRSVVLLDGPTARRVLATIGGSASAMLLASGLMLILFELAGALEPSAAPMVGAVRENMPAAAAGLARGDEILTIAGQPVKSLGDVSAMIDRTQGRPVAVDVLRDGERREVTLQAKSDGEHWRAGLELEEKQERVQLSFADSARRAARFPVEYSRYLAASL